MERTSVLSGVHGSDAEEAPALPRRRHAGRKRKLFVAAATVVASLAVSTPAIAWPMCGC